MGQARSYDQEYKVEAVKLVRKVETKKAAEKLGIQRNTLSEWIHKAKIGPMDLGLGDQAPQTRHTLAAENEEVLFYQLRHNMPKQSIPFFGNMPHGTAVHR